MDFPDEVTVSVEPQDVNPKLAGIPSACPVAQACNRALPHSWISVAADDINPEKYRAAYLQIGTADSLAVYILPDYVKQKIILFDKTGKFESTTFVMRRASAL